jgi:hypothetical protein
MKTPTGRRPSGACPTFFRRLCRTASMGDDGGYASAGYSLVRAVARLLDEHGDDRDALLEQLQAAISPPFGISEFTKPPDDDSVLAWFDRELPRCMALIPRARRASFLRGVYRAVLDEESPVTEY